MAGTYKCMFPNCTYSTSSREKIDYHHIKPKELGGSNKHHNRIFLCPTHHRHIYIPEAAYGIHSIKDKDSIIIKGYIDSTAGKGLRYIVCKDNREYAYLYSKNVVVPLD